VGAAGRRDGRHQRAAAAGQAPVHHHRESCPACATDAPTLRDPDRRTYFKEEVGGLVMGGYEPNPQPWTTNLATCPTIGSSACSMTTSTISSSI
jgi:hypothetical protein